MNKKGFIPGIWGITSAMAIAGTNSFPPTLIPTLSLGFTHFNEQPSKIYRISDFVSDSIHNTQQHEHASFSYSIKKGFDLNQSWLKKIQVGPAFYYQKASYSGDIWEMNSPEFNNYRYQLGSNNYNILLEGDLYFSPLNHSISPFITAGLGLGINQVTYNDYAQPGIPADSELHLGSRSNNKLIYEIGAGFAIPLNKNLIANLRYIYTHNGKAQTSTDTPNNLQEPLSIVLNNQAVFFGISFTS